MKTAIDYCPHCCCHHIIGQHPRDGETEDQYWKRVDIGSRSKYATMKHPTRSRPPPTRAENGNATDNTIN